jgi:hypothetical protein
MLSFEIPMTLKMKIWSNVFRNVTTYSFGDMWPRLGCNMPPYSNARDSRSWKLQIILKVTCLLIKTSMHTETLIWISKHFYCHISD